MAKHGATEPNPDKFRSVFEHAVDPMFVHDLSGNIMHANISAEKAFGYGHAELLGLSVADIDDHVTREQVVNVARKRRHSMPATFETVYRRKDGSTFPVEVHINAFGHGGQDQILAIVRDISERKAAEEALFKEKERAQVTLQSIGDAVIRTDASGVVDYANPAAEALLGVPLDRLQGQHHTRLVTIVDDVSGQAVRDPVAVCIATRRSHQEKSATLQAAGREFAIDLTAAPLHDPDGQVVGAVLVLRDVTEMRGLAKRLSYQASHDDLTGLFNRAEFEQRLEAALASARDDGARHALIYLDLDQFKVVNDTCGHLAGDELLKQVTGLLAAGIRHGDILARLGGDEFTLLLSGCPLYKAREIAENLRQVVKDYRFVWDGKVFDIGVSIGVVPISGDSVSRTEVMRAADMACYVAKDGGRNRVHVFEGSDGAVVRHHGEMQWVQRLAEALDEDRFLLYCQPLQAVGGGEYRQHYELLLRMHTADGELVGPTVFIPVAERYHMMTTVDRWMVRHALEILSDFIARERASDLVFAINVSGHSICDHCFLDFVLAELDATGLPGAALCFELTETAAVANLSQALHFMQTLAERGATFALDDFGSGLSSFGYLRALPVDILKIDGAFVRDVVDDPVDRAMVAAINQIGQLMGIRTVAEWVETPEVLRVVREMGVDFAQGFHIGRPVPLEDELARLAGTERRRQG